MMPHSLPPHRSVPNVPVRPIDDYDEPRRGVPFRSEPIRHEPFHEFPPYPAYPAYPAYPTPGAYGAPGTVPFYGAPVPGPPVIPMDPRTQSAPYPYPVQPSYYYSTRPAGGEDAPFTAVNPYEARGRRGRKTRADDAMAADGRDQEIYGGVETMQAPPVPATWGSQLPMPNPIMVNPTPGNERPHWGSALTHLHEAQGTAVDLGRYRQRSRSRSRSRRRSSWYSSRPFIPIPVVPTTTVIDIPSQERVQREPRDDVEYERSYASAVSPSEIPLPSSDASARYSPLSHTRTSSHRHSTAEHSNGAVPVIEAGDPAEPGRVVALLPHDYLPAPISWSPARSDVSLPPQTPTSIASETSPTASLAESAQSEGSRRSSTPSAFYRIRRPLSRAGSNDRSSGRLRDEDVANADEKLAAVVASLEAAPEPQIGRINHRISLDYPSGPPTSARPQWRQSGVEPVDPEKGPEWVYPFQDPQIGSAMLRPAGAGVSPAPSIPFPVTTAQPSSPPSMFSNLGSLMLDGAFFVTDVVPRQLYLHLLLRVPSLYFSRVARVFEDARLSLPDIKRMARARAEEWNDPMARYQMPDMLWQGSDAGPLPVALLIFKASWEGFIDSLMREWKTLNIISVLLLSAILTVLQINEASHPITRTAALFSLICALMSLLFGCMYIIRFGTMRKMHKASSFANEAQKGTAGIWWNVWVMLALPAVWLSWSIIAFFVCILSFIWLSGSTSDPTGVLLSPNAALGPRIALTAVFVLGLVYSFLIIHEFHRYGDPLDREWSRAVKGWINTYPRPMTPIIVDDRSPAVSVFRRPVTVMNLGDYGGVSIDRRAQGPLLPDDLWAQFAQDVKSVWAEGDAPEMQATPRPNNPTPVSEPHFYATTFLAENAPNDGLPPADRHLPADGHPPSNHRSGDDVSSETSYGQMQPRAFFASGQPDDEMTEWERQRAEAQAEGRARGLAEGLAEGAAAMRGAQPPPPPPPDTHASLTAVIESWNERYFRPRHAEAELVPVADGHYTYSIAVHTDVPWGGDGGSPVLDEKTSRSRSPQVVPTSASVNHPPSPTPSRRRQRPFSRWRDRLLRRRN